MKPCRWVVTGVAVAFLASVHAQQPTPASPGSAPPAAPANLLFQAAQGLGVKQCLPAVERLGELAIHGSRGHDVLVDWDRAQPDAGPFFGLMGISFGQQSVAATITAIPQGADRCTIAAERISVAAYTCQSIAQVELGAYRATALLPTFTVYTRAGDPGASVTLIDSPPGCLVIRRHVQYGWRDPAAAPTAAPPAPSGPTRR